MSKISIGPVDQTAATELELYIDNDADLYRQQRQPILKNLMTKKSKGIYDRAKAVKLYCYLMESGAKKYAKEFGNPNDWSRMFSPGTRKRAAEAFVEAFETEAESGNYDNFLPKKYQK